MNYLVKMSKICLLQCSKLKMIQIHKLTMFLGNVMKPITSRMILNVSLLLSIMIVQSIQSLPYSQIENQLERVNNRIIDYGRMDFLNQNLNNLTQHLSSRSQNDIFDKIKIRKFTTTKIDVTDELKRIQKMKYLVKNEDENKSYEIQRVDAKKQLIQNMNFISTLSLTSRKFEGLNLYSYVISQSYNKFYSLQGENVFSMIQKKQNNQQLDENKLYTSNKTNKIMISSLRNENFYIAEYEKVYSVRYNGQCLNIKISQVQMRNKQFIINTNLPYNNLVIETNLLEQIINQDSLYQHFFTYNTYQSKPSHYIFANKKQVHFYIYSEIAQQLIMDQNKTIKLTQIFNNPQQQIHTIIKLNTHLIILTNKNHLLSINLYSLLSSKKSNNIILYETVSLQFQKFYSIHFNDNDYRLFYILTDKNIYQYKLSTQIIIKKYPLKSIHCKSHIIGQKCTQNVWILQNYFLIQQKLTLNNFNSQYEYFLIEKASGKWHQFHIPFSHQNKCSQFKKIFISKNKNSHYIITLACFIQQKNNVSNSIQQKQKYQQSEYLILQHLNLETSTQITPIGQMGGIDFTKFRLPMIVFSIGLVCYITVKRSNKKSPQKIAQQQKLQKKFQEEVLSTIRRQKQRQEALNIARKKG